MTHPAESVQIETGWKKVLYEEFAQPYFLELKAFLQAEKQSGQIIYPQGKEIFNAFNKTPFDKVKVVILGQDPYHGPGQAHGLSFSVPVGIAPPPSLKNIYKELQTDVGIVIPHHGNLESWAEQGVLLLNAVLTVRATLANSHKGKGWEKFTTAAVKALNDQKEGLVFLLWGRPAQEKGSVIDPSRHYILKSVHPSPLSAHTGFFGCRHFSQTNEILAKRGLTPINWQV
ncbi:MAG: uracil-DNA glycosylase [Bacteroidia bacterium]|nr:uracil-DNA glycosylase [Bacteroidia bacterium]